MYEISTDILVYKYLYLLNFTYTSMRRVSSLCLVMYERIWFDKIRVSLSVFHIYIRPLKSLQI